VSSSLSFKIAKLDLKIFNTWVTEIFSGKNRKHTLMTPIPFGCGMIKFNLIRNKQGLNRLNPIFIMELELSNGDRVPLLYAKKRKLQKNASYLISLSRHLN